MAGRTLNLSYEQGTLVLDGLGESQQAFSESSWLKYDERTKQYRAPAHRYKDIILHFNEQGLSFKDKARCYKKLPLSLKEEIKPRSHQEKALEAWKEEFRGVVSLPTGAGKTILAVLAMAYIQRSTLVIAPTIDLVDQWQQVLRRFFDQPCGKVGGGEKNWQDITVATYDSARLAIELYGNRFAFLVVDECHHLPAPQYRFIAEASIAPFCLGLSATVERADGGEELIYQLLGEKVYEAQIQDMVEKVLAPYNVVSLEVDLTEKEEEKYRYARGVYTGFIRSQGINMGRPDGWQQFIIRSSRSPQGKAAMQAYREQKRLAQAASGKKIEIWNILTSHAQDSVIIFTDDNLMAYNIGQEMMLPVLTHKTKPVERKKILEDFRSGILKVIVTSKVLNEGVDVPEANVGVVVSGSGAVREHVQRLGRILRHSPGKQATLYEIITRDTSETFVNQRRRQHSAYQRSP